MARPPANPRHARARILPVARATARRGFTLVEALASGIILGLVAVLVGSIVTGALESARRARDFQTAAQLLDQTMQKIDMLGPDRILREGPVSGQFAGIHERFSWSAEVTSRNDGYLYEVQLTVSWPTPTGTRSAELRTLLHDEPDSRNPALRWEDL